ncbi:hypothetical protein EIP91_002798 [Steccherinum ochraceum]|uniref:Uncharacterized protein n=1 Tax=Steccherinum ochraceum TaxID=92696 RepID=A0A4R0RD75_9APHY|nr:hypothetical protein EIP91_002798 [Steccherinum ochraceum]
MLSKASRGNLVSADHKLPSDHSTRKFREIQEHLHSISSSSRPDSIDVVVTKSGGQIAGMDTPTFGALTQRRGDEMMKYRSTSLRATDISLSS